MGMKKVIFAFDLVCPYAYIASQHMVALGAAIEAKGYQVEWRPVLLGGLYGLTKAEQGKDGSATDVMPENKRAINATDLVREAKRRGVPLKFNKNHPVKSLDAMRLLCKVNDHNKRVAMALDLYKAYWVDGEDISREEVLEKVCKTHDVSKEMTHDAKETLRKNTEWLNEIGGFGVPTFYVNGRMFFGQDRMHFVARACGVEDETLSKPLRLESFDPSKALRRAKLIMYHDFSSPWSYLGSRQVRAVAEAHNADIEYRPILLGALFRAIGTPNVPMFAIPENKRAYGGLDMNDWCEMHKVELRFPNAFPLRTVTSLRVSIIEPRTIDVIYAGAWTKNINIGDEEELRKLLDANGFDGDSLIERAKTSQVVRDELKRNTEHAVAVGVCGVPTFAVDNDEELVWGQDRLNVVCDMLCAASRSASKL